MKNISTFLLLIFTQIAMAQHDTLNSNQSFAHINANGCLFTSASNNSSGYGVDDGSTFFPKLIYNSSFWVGAKDQNDSIRVCANGFIAGDKDFKTGPVANLYSAQSFIDKYDHVYSISSSEIQTHQQNWNNPNYTMPADIVNWPGNGDLSNGEATILAPFVDYNANNLYEPQLGDHPVIRGNFAQYFILNDNDGNHPKSGGMNLDMEYHFMVYQYVQSGFLDSTTFINLKIINRSGNSYNQLIVGNYIDFDIGGALDDLIGTSSSKNMTFGYNGDLIDDGSSGGVTLFGANPPACGVQLLNHNLGAAGYYNNSGGLLGDPNSDLKYWSNMNGNWADGTSFTEGGNGYGGAVPTNYIYDGNPNDSTVFADEYPSDRRAFLASEPIDDFMPGDYICYDFAVLYSRTGGNAFLNVNGLFDVADSAQLFYDAQPFYYCDPLLLGESEIYRHTNDFMIYPNPAQNEFKISVEGYFSIDIYDMTGKLIISKTGLNTGEFISAPKTAGIYLINIHNQQFSYSNKLVVE